MTSSQTWTAPTPDPAADGPLVGADRPILEAFLAWQRATLLTVCAGLTVEQLAERAVRPSRLSRYLGHLPDFTDVDASLVYVHMIAEYARHNGHADLLRERIDGVTGS